MHSVPLIIFEVPIQDDGYGKSLLRVLLDVVPPYDLHVDETGNRMALLTHIFISKP